MSQKKPTMKPGQEENKPKEQPKEKDEPMDNSENEKEKKDMENTKFQSLPLREYYDHAVTSVLLEGLRELGRQRFVFFK